MFAAVDDAYRTTHDDHDGLALAGTDTPDVRVVLARLEHADQAGPMVRTVATQHGGRRTYTVVASLPTNETTLADVVSSARRHAFMVVVPADLCDARGIPRHAFRDPRVLLEADLAHAITGTMQWLRRGDAMVVLCGCAATLALARRAIRLGRRWRASFDRPEGGDLSSVPSDPGMTTGNGGGT